MFRVLFYFDRVEGILDIEFFFNFFVIEIIFGFR